MNPSTLYQRVLGSEFSKLPPVLRRFHALGEGGSATGKVTVERKSCLAHHAAAGLLRLPQSGQNVPLRLQTIPQNGKEVWIRHFGEQRLETVQWQDGDCLIEKAGALCFAFRLAADEQGLTFHLQHNTMSGVQLPRGLMIRVSARAKVDTMIQGSENSWHITVGITVPPLGQVVSYQGEIFPHLL